MAPGLAAPAADDYLCFCITVKVCPATVSVPLRVFWLLSAATEYLTSPSPFPLLPEMMVIQPALLWAVHSHPGMALTLTLPMPPAADRIFQKR